MAFGNETNTNKLITPAVWTDWVNRNSTKTNRLVNSGILTADNNLSGKLLQPGYTIRIPVLNDLPSPNSAQPQEWSDNSDIQTNSIDADSESEIKFYDVQSFAASDVSQLKSGADVKQRIAGRFGNYFTTLDEQRTMQIAQIAFKNDDIKTAKSFHFGNEKALSAGDFIAAMARMGDVNNNLSQVAVNSAAYAQMRRQNLIDYVQPSEGGNTFPQYNGMNIVLDDSIPLNSDGTTYALIFGNGAIQYSIATPANGIVDTRDEFHAGGSEAIIQKRVSTIHVAGTTLDETQLSNGPEGFRSDLMAGNKSLYKPAGDPRNMNLVLYGFKVDNDLIVKGVNTNNSPFTQSSATTKK